ncbi:LacI family DNA-binding transcriptional regulator [Devosia sp. A449]
MATIKDVAARAQVSLSTVSHVINKTRLVLPETASRVELAIAELGYQPNSVARSLKSKKSMTIGMLITNTRNPFFADVLHGVEEQSFNRGYSLILCNTEDEELRQTAYLDTLRQKQVDALVVMTTDQNAWHFDLKKQFADVPTVSLFTSAKGVDLSISDDSFAGGMLAATRLIEAGARQLACISGQLNHRLMAARLAGFTAGAHRAGLTIPDDRVIYGDWSLEGGYRAMAELLNNPQGHPDGVFAMNDMMAIGALSRLHEAGVAVPDDVSLIGYDDIAFGAFTQPPLTSISQGGIEIGRLAIDSLLRIIDGLGVAETEILVTPKITERKSVRME